MCNGEIMGKDHTLEFVYMTRWRIKVKKLYGQFSFFTLCAASEYALHEHRKGKNKQLHAY